MASFLFLRCLNIGGTLSFKSSMRNDSSLDVFLYNFGFGEGGVLRWYAGFNLLRGVVPPR
jgi:hypothetical protein